MYRMVVCTQMLSPVNPLINRSSSNSIFFFKIRFILHVPKNVFLLLTCLILWVFTIHEKQTYEKPFFWYKNCPYVYKNSLDTKQCSWLLLFYQYCQHIRSVMDSHFVSYNLFLYHLNRLHVKSIMVLSKSW